MKTAIVQCADTGPCQSIELMLRAAGYRLKIPGLRLREELRSLGCDTVLDNESLHSSMGYALLAFPEATIQEMETCDLFVDIKGYRNGPKVWERWPRLRNRTLWYRINGGWPIDHPTSGNEVDPSCPIVTPNLWYAEQREGRKAFACWPPFAAFGDYASAAATRKGICDNRTLDAYTDPICLIHNPEGWGYSKLIPGVRELGVKMYGQPAPDGLIQNYEVHAKLARSLAMVHLKSNDCPGYSLYEAIAAACPIIVSRRLINRMHMQDLFVEGETCLGWDEPGIDIEGRGEIDIEKCRAEIEQHLLALHDPVLNWTIGISARERLKHLMFNPESEGVVFEQWLNEWVGK